MLHVQGMRDLTHAERTVLSVVAWHDGPGGARPSLERIAELAGMRRSTLAGHLQAIRDKGRLTWCHGRHVNEYTVHYGPGQCQGIPDGDSESQCQGIPAGQCQGFPDGNRKEHGAESDAGTPDPAPRVAAKPLQEGKEARTAKIGSGCPEGRGCAWLGRETQRCPACGAGDEGERR